MMRVLVALTLSGVVLLAGCSRSLPEDEPASEPTVAAPLSILDTTTTRAGTVREVLTDLQSAIPSAIAEYAACVATTPQYPRPFDLPCRPYGGSDESPGYGLTNLLGYVATGEKDALAVATGECAIALGVSHSDSLSGWALQDAVKALNDTFVVGYPEIEARLQAFTDALSRKQGAVAEVLATC